MPKREIPETTFNQIIALYRSGLSLRAVADEIGCHHSTVDYWLKQRGITLRTNAQAKRLYSLNERAFEAVSTEAQAYWLGFLFADGCVSVKNAASKTLGIVLQERDLAHLEAFRTFLDSNAPIKRQKPYNTFGLFIHSVKLADDLIALGCVPAKSNATEMDYPPIPNPLNAAFIRGYFDGDGSAFTSGGSLTMSFCGNAQFLTTLQTIIGVSAGVDGAIYPHSVSKQVHYLTYRGKTKTTALRAWLYRDATIYLKRKFDVGSVGHVSEATVKKYIANQRSKP